MYKTLFCFIKLYKLEPKPDNTMVDDLDEEQEYVHRTFQSITIMLYSYCTPIYFNISGNSYCFSL